MHSSSFTSDTPGNFVLSVESREQGQVDLVKGWDISIKPSSNPDAEVFTTIDHCSSSEV